MPVERTSGQSELVQVFEKLNARYFNNSLKATLEWSSRMLVIAGNCNWRRRHPPFQAYHTEYPDKIEATMLHEMLHLALKRGHDARFREAAAAFRHRAPKEKRNTVHIFTYMPARIAAEACAEDAKAYGRAVPVAKAVTMKVSVTARAVSDLNG